MALDFAMEVGFLDFLISGTLNYGLGGCQQIFKKKKKKCTQCNLQGAMLMMRNVAT